MGGEQSFRRPEPDGLSHGRITWQGYWPSGGRALRLVSRWKIVFVSVPEGPLASGIVGRTYVISLQPGQILPSIPAGGFQTMDDLSKLPGVRVIEAYGAAPGPTSDVYAFARSSVQRNLYRIPIP